MTNVCRELLSQLSAYLDHGGWFPTNVTLDCDPDVALDKLMERQTAEAMKPNSSRLQILLWSNISRARLNYFIGFTQPRLLIYGDISPLFWRIRLRTAHPHFLNLPWREQTSFMDGPLEVLNRVQPHTEIRLCKVLQKRWAQCNIIWVASAAAYMKLGRGIRQTWCPSF